MVIRIRVSAAFLWVPKGFDSEILLDALEEKLSLPARMMVVSNGFHSLVEVVGKKQIVFYRSRSHGNQCVVRESGKLDPGDREGEWSGRRSGPLL